MSLTVRHNIDDSFEVWSNFEIADMNFWRGEAYTAFFNYLDSRGGFYYEVCVRTRPASLDPDTEPITALGRCSSP
jgi:hypothetical protein